MPTIIDKWDFLPEVDEGRSVEDVEPLGRTRIINLHEVDP